MLHAPAAESVTMAADGRFIMLDRYGAVREAAEQGGQLVLNPKPLAHLGPGRPLGAQFDKHGNLIICDAFKVRLHAAEQCYIDCKTCKACSCMQSSATACGPFELRAALKRSCSEQCWQLQCTFQQIACDA